MEYTKATIKTIALVLIAISIHHSCITKEQPYNNNNNGKETTFDETDKLALQTFSNTINSMFNIVQQPDDKQNVIGNVGNIISGIFNFVAQAIAHNKLPDQYYKQLDKALQTVLKHYIHIQQ